MQVGKESCERLLATKSFVNFGRPRLRENRLPPVHLSTGGGGGWLFSSECCRATVAIFQRGGLIKSLFFFFARIHIVTTVLDCIHEKYKFKALPSLAWQNFL